MSNELKLNSFSKIKSIFTAFFKGKNISKKLHRERLEHCRVCIYNSDNIHDSDLSVFDRMRKRAIKHPFCIKCGCQINEKTGQKTESCPLGKWGRLVLETNNNFVVRLNDKGSSDIVSMDIVDGDIVFVLPDFKRNNVDEYKIKFFIEGVDDNFRFLESYVSCGACMRKEVNSTIDFSNIEKNDIDIVFHPRHMEYGDFIKSFYFVYSKEENGRGVLQKVIFKGKNV